MWSCMTIIPAVPVQKQKLSPYNEIQFWGNRGLKNVQNMIRKPKILIDMYLKCIKTFLEFKWISFGSKIRKFFDEINRLISMHFTSKSVKFIYQSWNPWNTWKLEFYWCKEWIITIMEKAGNCFNCIRNLSHRGNFVPCVNCRPKNLI